MKNKKENKQKESFFIRMNKKWNNFREQRKKLAESWKTSLKDFWEKFGKLQNKIPLRKIFYTLAGVSAIILIFVFKWKILLLLVPLALLGTAELMKRVFPKENGNQTEN